MTSGSIVRQILLISLPLMLGNIFQMLYNTVDSIVVGNFVGKEALAAVGMSADDMRRYPYEFSGGQRQRISIARTLSVNPEFVMCPHTELLDRGT